MPVAPMPAHKKPNLIDVGLFGFKAIVFLAKHLAHLVEQALGLGKIGDRVHEINNIYK